MKFQRFSGRVDFDQGSIDPRVDRSAFLESELGRAAEVMVDNEPHMTYRIRPEPGIAAAVYFEGPRLRTLSWQLELPRDMETTWSVEHELERKRVHDDWLRQEIGKPPYQFAWGRLESDYDPKGCASAIIISYVE
jgi:hypothetical protein